MGIRIIYSSIFTDFQICPALYFYKYIENYKELLFSSTEESKKGEAIHSIIDSHFKGYPLSEKYITSDEKIDKWWKYYLENYSQLLPGTYSEYSFNLPFETQKEKVILTGRVDRIIKNEKKVTIIDWKTNSKKTAFSNITNTSQMDFYAYCISKVMEVESVETKIVYLELMKEETTNFDKEALKVIENKITDMINKTHPAIKEYIPKPIYLDKETLACKICNFYSQCENYL